MMRFKLDENIPLEAVDLFRHSQLDVHTVYDEQLAGSIDHKIATACIAENRALITLDLDFADIRTYPPNAHPGIIVLRPKVQTKPLIITNIGRVIQLLTVQPVDRLLWIVDETSLRIRGE